MLALLGPGGAAARPHEDPDPGRRAARRILQRLDGMGKWGGYHTEFAHLARGFAGNDRALAQEVGEALLEAGLLAEKPSVGQRHVYLNPRRAAEIRKLIDTGEVPPGMTAAVQIGEIRHAARFPRRAARHAGADEAAHAGHAHARGDRAPRAARPPVAHRARAAALRHHARRGLHRRRAATSRTSRRSSTSSARSPSSEVDERTNALAHALARRRHRARATASRSCAATTAAGSTPCSPARKLGANALFLNTAFSGPQLTDVAKREKPKAVIYDHEFAEVLKDAGDAAQALRRLARARGRQGRGPAAGGPDRAAATPRRSTRPAEQGRAIILTSGTTGTPKGASRSMPKSIDPIAVAAVGDPAARRARRR